MRPCAALGELKVARIHDIRFILCLGCGVCVGAEKRRDVGQATTNSRREYKRADACMSKSDPKEQSFDPKEQSLRDLTTRSRA